MNKKDFLQYILECYVSITRDRPDTRLGFCTYIDISRVSRACYVYIAQLSFVHLWKAFRILLYRCEGHEEDIVKWWQMYFVNDSVSEILDHMFYQDYHHRFSGIAMRFKKFKEKEIAFNKVF